MRALLRYTARKLSLHEFQAAALLGKNGLPVVRGEAVQTPGDAIKVAEKLKTDIVLKAQVHAGGRGRGVFKNSKLQSGVHIVKSPKEVGTLASKMIGDILITKQTGAEGKPVSYLYVTEKVSIKRELYIAITTDREKAAVKIIASSRGGMGIEELDPKYVLQHCLKGTQVGESDLEAISQFMEPENAAQKEQFKDIVSKLTKTFVSSDATLIEINPLGVLEDGRVAICDSKVTIDDNALFRQKELAALEDITQKDATEVNAQKDDLNYIKLSGDIGCLVNGAGLAMATMDLINFKGGKPANFLDIGGGATPERVRKAIEIINSDTNVKSILVNIFGGIVRCDVVAQGVISAVEALRIQKPIVMRIKGTNSEEAKEMVKSSKLKIFWDENPDSAVGLCVQQAVSSI